MRITGIGLTTKGGFCPIPLPNSDVAIPFSDGPGKANLALDPTFEHQNLFYKIALLSFSWHLCIAGQVKKIYL